MSLKSCLLLNVYVMFLYLYKNSNMNIFKEIYYFFNYKEISTLK